MTQANLGMSVGRYHERLNDDFVPDPTNRELDRKEAYAKWDQSKDRWVPNEISNFLKLKVPIEYGGLNYPTIEHYHQAMKSLDQSYREVIAKCDTPNKTKWLAHKLAMHNGIRFDWEDINLMVMTFAQRHRIDTDPEFAQWLCSTRHRYLYEWNNWTDLYWGCSIYSGEGENVLGRILMHLRDNVYWRARWVLKPGL